MLTSTAFAPAESRAAVPAFVHWAVVGALFSFALATDVSRPFGLSLSIFYLLPPVYAAWAIRGRGMLLCSVVVFATLFLVPVLARPDSTTFKRTLNRGYGVVVATFIMYLLAQRQRLVTTLEIANLALEERVAARTSELETMNDELAASRERLQQLSRQLIAAQESERRHLARELHDEIGQILTAVSISLQQVKSLVPASELGRIDNSVGIVSQAIQAVRDMSLNLRPSMLDDFGLVATVRWYLERQQSLTDCELKLEADSFKVALPTEINTACYRVVQEAINNILRHARAQHAWVHIDLVDGEVQITIRDDGIGFQPIEAGQRSTQADRLGILGMEERVKLLGGQFELQSHPGNGTTIRLEVPLVTEVDLDKQEEEVERK